MKKTALIAILVCAVVGISCERHSWEETKVLHEHGAKHEEGTATEHKDGPAAPGASHEAGAAGKQAEH